MARLIDADGLLDVVKNKYHDIVAGRYPFNIVAYDMATLVENAPTVDAVEVVRCKDCRYYNKTNWTAHGGWCEAMQAGKHDKAYCSYGEKMDGDQEKW